MQGFPHHYLVSATAGNEGNVVVSSNGLPDLDTQPPAEFGGPGDTWSPETLLTASVTNCFVLTFRAIAGASKFEWNSLECAAEGVLERPERNAYFTAFKLHAVLHIPAGARAELAQRLLEKSEQLCLITASLKSEITLTTDVRVD